MKKIKVLKLTDTKSGTYETEQLFEALSKYQHLSELKLNNFTINSTAAISLAEVINNNMFLKKIDIGWNTMTHSEDFLKMLQEVKTNTYVVEANFSNTPCSKSQRGFIAQCLYEFIRNPGSNL